MCGPRQEGSVDQETKFLWLRVPVVIGSYFRRLAVLWLGGWTKHWLLPGDGRACPRGADGRRITRAA
jgi:hypothetical protein